jgi:hypothetical protein
MNTSAGTMSRRDSPAWTARHAMVAAGLATDTDLRGWERAVDARLASSGPIEIVLPAFTVVARRP